MNNRRKYVLGGICVVLTIIIILDSKTALSGAVSGIELCIKTVIPALFPFFFLTGIITSTLNAPLSTIFRPIGRFLKIPKGTESILMLGLLGGYPIGAQAVNIHYQSGNINKKAAQRMLTFCNNPGPAFIFGMAGCLFDTFFAPWLIWFIIILGSFITARIMPIAEEDTCQSFKQRSPATVESAIKSTSLVCSWVILFRVLIAVLNRWFLWIFPKHIAVILTGILELTNGCAELFHSSSMVFRFCSVTAFLCFGGLCVTFQTFAVTRGIMNHKYPLAKLFQASVSIPISYIAASFLFSHSFSKCGILISAMFLLLSLFLGFILHKNNTGNLMNLGI